jgi:hypothetical protein
VLLLITELVGRFIGDLGVAPLQVEELPEVEGPGCWSFCGVCTDSAAAALYCCIITTAASNITYKNYIFIFHTAEIS